MMARASVLALAAALLIGCGGSSRIVHPKVSRTPVVFESTEAASAFTDEVSERYERGDAQFEKAGWRLSQNAFFNEQVGVADANRDGIITDVEAIRYRNVDN
jgi:hypothetical protein